MAHADNAAITCSTVPTRASGRSGRDNTVHSRVSLTQSNRAGISTPRSRRRNTIPVSAGAGRSVSVTACPSCSPTPLQPIGLRRVDWRPLSSWIASKAREPRYGSTNSIPKLADMPSIPSIPRRQPMDRLSSASIYDEDGDRFQSRFIAGCFQPTNCDHSYYLRPQPLLRRIADAGRPGCPTRPPRRRPAERRLPVPSSGRCGPAAPRRRAPNGRAARR